MITGYAYVRVNAEDTQFTYEITIAFQLIVAKSDVSSTETIDGKNQKWNADGAVELKQNDCIDALTLRNIKKTHIFKFSSSIL